MMRIITVAAATVAVCLGATGMAQAAVPASQSAPAVTGTAEQGYWLTTSNGTWANSPTGYVYGWQDCGATGGSCVTISGQTASTFLLRPADVGHEVVSVVRASNANGSATAFSVATAAVPAGAPSATGLSAISGTPEQAATLTSSTGAWTGSPTVYLYQWMDCNSTGGYCAATVPYASTFTLQAADVGHEMRVHVRAQNAYGRVWGYASAPTAVVTTTAGVQPDGPPGAWTPAFDDEFNGTSLDRTKWSPCWFYPTCGSQNNAGTNPANVSVSNGNLVLTLASSASGASVSTNPSGGTSPGFQFQYGVVEARIWFPGDGSHCYNWPAWWTDGQSWPTNGENDIAEVLGGDMTVNYHSSSGNFQEAIPSGYWCGGFHTYTLDRMAGHSYVYYDGTLVKSYTTDDGGAPQYVIVNVGASSDHPAYGTASQVRVDYVRAWRTG